MTLISCGDCRHYTESMPTTRFGACAINHWAQTVTPSKGRAMTPNQMFYRYCEKYEVNE